MKRIPAWLSYVLLRLVLLVVPLLVCWLLLGIPLWLSFIFAVVIAFALSTLLLYRIKQRAIADIESRRKPKPARTDSDEAIEDAL